MSLLFTSNRPLKKAPYHLEYITQYKYDDGITVPQPPSVSSYRNSSPHDVLAAVNAGRLPYISTAKGSHMISVDMMSMIVECEAWTGCTVGDACPQRQAQKVGWMN